MTTDIEKIKHTALLALQFQRGLETLMKDPDFAARVEGALTDDDLDATAAIARDMIAVKDNDPVQQDILLIKGTDMFALGISRVVKENYLQSLIPAELRSKEYASILETCGASFLAQLCRHGMPREINLKAMRQERVIELTRIGKLTLAFHEALEKKLEDPDFWRCIEKITLAEDTVAAEKIGEEATRLKSGNREDPEEVWETSIQGTECLANVMGRVLSRDALRFMLHKDLKTEAVATVLENCKAPFLAQLCRPA